MKTNNEKEKKQKGSFLKVLKSTKFRRGGMATMMSVIFIAIVVVLNITVSALATRFPSMNVDLTAQKLNSLSDQAVGIAKEIKNDTQICIIGDEDAIRKDQVFASYNLKYSQVANLADKLHEVNQKITVEFVNPDTSPKFISEYAAENLTSGKVLIKTEKRHRVLEITDLFSMTQNQQGTGYDSFSLVDSALASAIESVNLDTVPIVAVATGHDELLSTENRQEFDKLLKDENFDVQEVSLITADIPEGTQVLMLPTPTTDYTKEEVQKMRDFLSSDVGGDRTIFLTCHPTQGELPVLAGFLEEWGVKVEQGLVAETDNSRVASTNPSYILANKSEELFKENEYKLLISPTTSPITLLFDANDDIGTQRLWTSSDSAYIAKEEGDIANPKTAEQTLATLSSKMVQKGDELSTKAVAVFGSSLAFTDSFIGSDTFSNRSYVSDLFHYVTGTDASAVTVSTEKVQTNALDISAPVELRMVLGLGVFTVIIPLVILIVGLGIFLKRRHL